MRRILLVNKKILIYVLSWALVILSISIILKFSFENGTESGESSTGIVDIILRIFTNGKEISPEFRASFSSFVRTLAHYGMYFILGLSLVNAFIVTIPQINNYSSLIAFAGALQIAMIDEYTIQANTSGREADFNDIVIDSFGAITSILIYLLVLFVVKKFKSKRKS